MFDAPTSSRGRFVETLATGISGDAVIGAVMGPRGGELGAGGRRGSGSWAPEGSADITSSTVHFNRVRCWQ